MARVEIFGWKDHDVGFTGWDNHARTELTKRLRRAINTSPSKIKDLARQIRSKRPAILDGVHDNSIASLRQILETMGAEMRVMR